MNLKKLYADTCVLCKGETKVYDFLLYADMAARLLISKYPKYAVLPIGEYVTPDSLDGDMPIDGEFYTAMLCFAAGMLSGSEELTEKSERAAESAYISAWRKSARGKRLKGDRW